MSDQPVFVAVCPFCGEIHPTGIVSDVFEYDKNNGQGVAVNPHIVVFVTCLDRKYRYQFYIPLDKWNTRVKPD